MPSDFELNVRLSHAPDTESDGNSAARATTGTSPEASRTASANDKRSDAVGAGVCAASWADAATSQASTGTSRELVLRNTMEIKVDVSVEVLLDVERLRHAGPERMPCDNRVHQWRHGELGGNHDVH